MHRVIKPEPATVVVVVAVRVTEGVKVTENVTDDVYVAENEGVTDRK